MPTVQTTQQPPPARPGLFLNVRDYGARGTGVTDDSPAIQATFAAAVATGIRHVHFPPGDYLLGSAVGMTNTSLQVSGSGIEVTKLLVNNATGGLTFVSSGVTGTDGSAHHLWLHDLTVVAGGTGALNRGTAIRAAWPVASAVPDTPHVTLTNVGIRSQTYDANHTSNPYFTKGVHLVNPHDARLTDVHISQINNTVGDMIHIDNAPTADAFRATIRGVLILGGFRGIAVTGWMEDVQVSDFELAGQTQSIDIDGTTSAVQNPALLITNGHANGQLGMIAVRHWADIHVSNVSSYAAPGSGTGVITGMYFEACREVTVTNAKLGSAPPGTHPVTLIHLSGVARFTVTGTLFDVVHDTAGVLSQGLAVVLGSTLGLIQGNVFALSNVATDTRGIFLQPDVLNTDQLTITHNRFENVATGIVAVDLSNALIEGNVYAGTGTPLTLVGTVGTQVIVRGNHPQTSRLTLATNASAPLVAGAPDGLVVANNSASTTITQFQGGYEGMQLEVYTANGNTTLQHSVNLLLAGSANVTLSAGSLLTLRRTLGAWREVSRTVL